MAYTVFNAPSPTTAAVVKVTTGTAIKTMLQLATPSTRQIRIIEWGYSLDAAPATTGVGVVELIQTDVAATVTAHIASGIVNDDPNGTASLLTLGTSATGYTASAEGTTTASRLLDAQEVAGVSNGADPTTYLRTFLPGAQPIVAVSKFLRVRVTFSAATNGLFWVKFEEI
jgi:hypothetical protein